MTLTPAFLRLREQAIALRREGKSRREIKEILRIRSNETLNEALKGEPPADRTKRPRAKDDLRAKARDLRAQGLNYKQIATELDVSKSSVSLWVRDLPTPPRLSPEESRKRAAEGVRRYWDAERPVREAKRAAERVGAAAEIGTLSGREILIAGAIAYWCEGTKSKPHRLAEHVTFMNSDPLLIGFFLRFLDGAGVRRNRLVFHVHIHENADPDAAQRFWQEITGGHPEQFGATTLKRHNPKTIRKNIDADYHGCLRIDVLRSSELYRKIAGWAGAAMAQDTPDGQVA
jgi:DNA-binding CsgD family transcriptional regulator